MSQYTINYGADGSAQMFSVEGTVDAVQTQQTPPVKRWRVPSIIKTSGVFLMGAVVLFSWETVAPEGFRISTFMGTYDARIAAAVKAAELQQQSRYEVWAAGLKIAADQQTEQYKAVTQGVLNNYSATYELGKIATQAAYEVQGRYTATLMQQKTMEQGSDIGIINLVRGFGRVMNGLEAGSGDDALNYSKNLSGELQGEITDTVRRATGTPVVKWGTGIASPDEVRAALDRIKPLVIPPPPSLGEAAATIGDPLARHS